MENQIKGVGDETVVDAAFERIKPELMALEADDLFQVSLDISAGITTVLGVLPEVRALREQIVKELPLFDLVQFDKLEDYALTLGYAQSNYQAAILPPDDLEALTTESTRLRDTLHAEARALIHRGVVSEEQLAQLSGARGYRNLATDLLLLKKVMQAVWSQIEGKTQTTAQELETASRLATRLWRVVGLREQGPARVAEATDLRQRAFVKLMRCYHEVRRAVIYLRDPFDDADQIAPALHQGRPRKRVEPKPEPAVPAVTTPAGTTGTTVPAAPASTSVAGPFV